MKPCCLDPSNIIIRQEKPDTISRRCQICNAKTIEVTLDPGDFKFRLE